MTENNENLEVEKDSNGYKTCQTETCRNRENKYQNLNTKFSEQENYQTVPNSQRRKKLNDFPELNVLAGNIGNVRYPGFSPFQSMNTLQNSSYCFSIPKGKRFENGKNQIVQNIYNLPSQLSARSTTQGFGNKKAFNIYFKAPSPDTYNLRTCFDTNLFHHKGPKIGLRTQTEYGSNKAKFFPGPGTYRVRKENLMNNIPITIKSRQFYFYDDDLRKKKHCVSMQKYHPNTILEENLRFRNIAIGFGLGGRTANENTSVKNYPGPGTYNVPGNFDRGLKGKLALN